VKQFDGAGGTRGDGALAGVGRYDADRGLAGFAELVEKSSYVPGQPAVASADLEHTSARFNGADRATARLLAGVVNHIDPCCHSVH
jgi:hypothetical protein